jgi:L-iditol 2-dehydrogenase
MKALWLEAYRQLKFRECAKPSMARDEVLIRIHSCGICGSDIHGYDGSTGRRIPPLIMGHEAAGVVEQVGGEVKGFREGDRVTFDSTIWCGACYFCRRGEANLCDCRQVLGVSCSEYCRAGAMAEYVSVPARVVCPIPPDLSFEHACMVEAVAVAVHAVGLTPVRLGDTAVVVGAGLIGLLVIQALKVAGCLRVAAVDVDSSRLRLARQMGATECVDASAEDAEDRVRQCTENRGADIAVEAVGASETVPRVLRCVRKGGAVTLIGNVSPQVVLPLQTVVTRQIRLTGSCASAGEYPAALELLAARRIDVQSLISAAVPLEDGPQWFERLYGREANLMKVILQP